MQQEVLKFNDMCVGWSSPNTDLVANFLNLENQIIENVSFSVLELFKYIIDISLLVNLFISFTGLRNIYQPFSLLSTFTRRSLGINISNLGLFTLLNPQILVKIQIFFLFWYPCLWSNPLNARVSINLELEIEVFFEK